MIGNIFYALIVQAVLFKVNKKINYDYENKKLALIGSLVVAILYSILGMKSYFSTGIVPITTMVLLINVAFIDLKYYEIPDTYSALMLVLGISHVIKAHNWAYIIVGLISFVLFFVISMVSGGALGGGDIKLSLGLGMFFTLYKYTRFLIYTFGVGAVIALILMIFKKGDKKTKVPFAPFMAVGAILVFLI